MANHADDSKQSPYLHGRSNPWFRLFLVMTIPVLLLLIVIFFSR
jgi:hypothetical protein